MAHTPVGGQLPFSVSFAIRVCILCDVLAMVMVMITIAISLQTVSGMHLDNCARGVYIKAPLNLYLLSLLTITFLADFTKIHQSLQHVSRGPPKTDRRRRCARTVRLCLRKTNQQKCGRLPPMICSGPPASTYQKRDQDLVMSASSGLPPYERLWAMKIRQDVAMVEWQRTKEHNVLSCLSRSPHTLCACTYQKAVLGLDMVRAGATPLKTKERLMDMMCSAPRSLLS